MPMRIVCREEDKEGNTILYGVLFDDISVQHLEGKYLRCICQGVEIYLVPVPDMAEIVDKHLTQTRPGVYVEKVDVSPPYPRSQGNPQHRGKLEDLPACMCAALNTQAAIYKSKYLKLD